MRLEPEMWNALAEICAREKCSIRDVCTLIDANRSTTSLTSAVRVFILAYFRFAGNDIGANNGLGGGVLNGANTATPAQPNQGMPAPALNVIVSKIFAQSA